jgi:PAS domain S-box-containing protein
MKDGDSSAATAAILLHARLFDTNRQAVIATTLAGAIVHWNAVAETIYGWSAAEVYGKHVNDVTPTNLTRDDAERIMKALQRGRTWSGTFLVRSRHGDEFEVEVRDIPVRDATGEMIGIIGVSTMGADRKALISSEPAA